MESGPDGSYWSPEARQILTTWAAEDGAGPGPHCFLGTMVDWTTGLKLDIRFVRALTPHEDSPANALAAGLSGLAAGLGLVGVAEGAETEEQAHVLRAQGWSHGQGWLYGKPAPLP